MGFFSNLFSVGEKSAEQVAAEKIAEFMSKRRGLIIGLVWERLGASGGASADAEKFLQQLTDNMVNMLPEAGIVTMTVLYKKAIGEGASHQVALRLVNMTRMLPVLWEDVSQFETLEDYVMERLQVEFAEADARYPVLRYLTKEHVTHCIRQTN
jgi:hypothetical protein